jgi:hypothetical protein
VAWVKARLSRASNNAREKKAAQARPQIALLSPT